MPALWAVRFAPQLLGALLVAGLLWAAYSWAHGRGTASERARWEQATREAGERFSEALAAQQATLEATDAELAKARRSANRSREALSDVVQTDPASRDWAAGAIPDRVRGILAPASGAAVPADPARADD
jgi:hypothetical protein